MRQDVRRFREAEEYRGQDVRRRWKITQVIESVDTWRIERDFQCLALIEEVLYGLIINSWIDSLLWLLVGATSKVSSLQG